MCRLLLMTVACLMVLFGMSGLYMMPKLIQQKIEQRLQLKPNTKTFDRFTKVPIPLTVKIYFFNISNSDKVLDGTERPKFEEVGPFMFKQWRRRDVVDHLDNNRQLRYREYKTFYPILPSSPVAPTPAATDQQASRHNIDASGTNTHQKIDTNNSTLVAGSSSSSSSGSSIGGGSGSGSGRQEPLDPRQHNITIVNVPLLAALTTLSKLEESSVKRKLASKIASRLIADKSDKILISRPANELLFDGTRVNFMDSAKDLVSDVLGFNFDSPLPNNKFGFFYLKNNTWSRRENGELTVYTGRNGSMDDFMMIDNWNDLKQLKVWPANTVAGDRCNQIKGTDGSQFHPGVRRDQTLELFSPLVCTSLHVVYKEDTQCRDIPLLRFITPSELFAAPRKNPRNACYCTVPAQPPATSYGQSQPQPQQQPQPRTKINDSRCYLDGLMDLSLCQKGAPIAASSPHFYNADPMLAMAAGLKPNKDIHQTYLDIEPMTGAVMRAASRAQINAYVEQSSLDVIDSSVLGHMTPMVAPLFWLEEAAEIDEKSSAEFKGQLLSLVQKARRSCIYAIVLGVLLALAVSLQYWYVTCYSIDTDELRRQKKERLRQRRQRIREQRDRAPHHQRHRLPGALGGGAKHSNRENMDKPMLLESAVQFVGPAHEDELLSSSSSSSATSETAKAALPAVVAAVVLGAASAGPSGHSQRKQRLLAAAHERRPRSAGRPPVTNDGDQTKVSDDDGGAGVGGNDEEELSRRMLVANEWKPATASNEPSGGDGSGSGNSDMSDVQAAGERGQERSLD